MTSIIVISKIPAADQIISISIIQQILDFRSFWYYPDGSDKEEKLNHITLIKISNSYNPPFANLSLIVSLTPINLRALNMSTTLDCNFALLCMCTYFNTHHSFSCIDIYFSFGSHIILLLDITLHGYNLSNILIAYCLSTQQLFDYSQIAN